MLASEHIEVWFKKRYELGVIGGKRAAPETLRTRKSYLRRVVASLGDARVEDLGHEHREDLIESLHDAGLSPQTQTIIRSLVLQWQKDTASGAVGDLPAVPDIWSLWDSPGTAGVREVVILDGDKLEEYVRWTYEKRPTIAPYLALMGLAGLRFNEARKLRWGRLTDYTKANGAIVAEALFLPGEMKQRRAQRYYIIDRCRNLLGDRKAPDELVVGRSLSRQRILSEHQWMADWFFDKKGATLHGLRHSYATWLRRRGIPLEEIQIILGHSNLATTMRYVHAEPAGMGERLKAALG